MTAHRALVRMLSIMTVISLLVHRAGRGWTVASQSKTWPCS